MNFKTITLCLSLCVMSQAAQADNIPTLSGEAVFELQNEYTAESDDTGTDGYNNMFLRTEVAPTIQFNENFYFDGVLVFENIQDRDQNDNNFFDNEGAFIEELKLNYESGAWSAFAGKFNPYLAVHGIMAAVFGAKTLRKIMRSQNV